MVLIFFRAQKGAKKGNITENQQFYFTGTIKTTCKYNIIAFDINQTVIRVNHFDFF